MSDLILVFHLLATYGFSTKVGILKFQDILPQLYPQRCLVHFMQDSFKLGSHFTQVISWFSLELSTQKNVRATANSSIS